jgi:hypothetical protein
MPGHVKRCVGVRVSQMNNKHLGIRDGHSFGCAVAYPFCLIEVGRASKEETLTFELGILGRELTIL